MGNVQQNKTKFHFNSFLNDTENTLIFKYRKAGEGDWTEASINEFFSTPEILAPGESAGENSDNNDSDDDEGEEENTDPEPKEEVKTPATTGSSGSRGGSSSNDSKEGKTFDADGNEVPEEENQEAD